MHIQYKKSTSILILIILVVLIGLFLRWINARRPQIIQLGATVVIDSEKEKEDRKKGLPTNACLFDGKIEITLLESKLYDDNEEAGISNTYIVSEQRDEEQFLLVTFEIRNIDAVTDFAEGFLSSSYSLISYRDKENVYMQAYNPEVKYSSVFQESVESNIEILLQPKEGWYYKLNPGETKVIKLGYFVEREAYENNKIAIKYATGNDGPPKTIFLIQ